VVKGQKGRSFFLMLLMIGVFSCFSFAASAALLRNNITFSDITLNSTSMLNLTANGTLSSTSGHLFFDNISGSGNFGGEGSELYAGNDTTIMDLGYWWKSMFSLSTIPNSTFRSFNGDTYGTRNNATWLYNNKLIAVVINESGTLYYASVLVTEVNRGNDVSLEIIVNTVAGNTSMSGSTDSCSSHSDFGSCTADYTNQCQWYDMSGICESFASGSGGSGMQSTIPPAECGMLPKAACDGINTDVCVWDVNVGVKGRCTRASLYDTVTGYQCENITNISFCSNQSYTMKTGLCSWNSTNCLKNTSKTYANVANPPVFSCSASGYYENQTACEILESVYYLPCGWNNGTSRCSELFMDFVSFNSFEDIGSENTCAVMGGTWQTETVYDPVSGQFTSESWCEFGTRVTLFNQIGNTNGRDFGNTGQFNDCNQDCFACEFLSNGSRLANVSVARTTCESSNASCTFTADTNAMNGMGWCHSASMWKDIDCNNNCGDCSFQPSPQTACLNSFANCKWDNITNLCISGGAKSCNQDCLQCYSESSCNATTANGGCTWDTLSYYCKPQGGDYEICFDGVDNNDNGIIDCADPKCSFDPFCGGSVGDTKNCYQYDTISHQGGAEANCTAVSGCVWTTGPFGYSYCAPAAESCHMNTSLTTKTICDSHFGGSVCSFTSSNNCVDNTSLSNTCFSLNQTTCQSTASCAWSSDYQFCDFAPYLACVQNQSLQSDQTACQAAGCFWSGDQFQNFEGGYAKRCVSPCGNTSINSEGACTSANGTRFAAGTCVWTAGYCGVKNFIGGCVNVNTDGDITACQANTNCNWYETDYAPLKNFNGSTGFNNHYFTNETWLAVGLEYPRAVVGSSNSSNYTLNRVTGSQLRLYVSGSISIGAENVTRLFCDSSVLMQYNWSTQNCDVGKCMEFNITTCNGKSVYYYFRNTTKALEAVWAVDRGEIALDSTEGNVNASTTTTKATILINGNLSEHDLENASTNDGSNASRVLSSSGFCDDLATYAFFTGMDQAPPMPIAGDATGLATEPAHSYLDISGVGLKKTDESYAYGIPVLSLTNSSYCNGVAVSGGQNGAGRNVSKYYLYLDTDGSTVNGCAALDNPSVSGFEYLFKYIANTSDDGRMVETKVVQNCQNSAWVSSSVSFSSDRAKGCSFIGGPIFAI